MSVTIKTLDKNIESVGSLGDEYFRLPRASSTMLRYAIRSPRHALYSIVPKEPTPEMRLGTVFHAALLEPDRFSQQFVRGIEGDGRRKEIKAARARLAEQWGEENIVDPKVFDKVLIMMSSVMMNPALEHVTPPQNIRTLTGCRVEVPILFDYTVGSERLPMKSKIDLVVDAGDGKAIVVDFKTTANAEPGAFMAQVSRMNYHVQASVYFSALTSIGIEPVGFYFVAVESRPPHASSVIKLGADSIAAGDALATKAAVRVMKIWDTVVRLMNDPNITEDAIMDASLSIDAYGDHPVELDIASWAFEPIEEVF